MPSITQLLIEILAIGSIGVVWVGLFLAKVPALTSFAKNLDSLKAFAPLIVLIGIAVIYQLGWIINWVAWRLTLLILERRRVKLFLQFGVKYQDIRPEIYQKASPAALGELKQEISEMRMCRANCLNALLIAIAALLYGRSLLSVATIALALFVFLGVQTYFVHIHHYQKLYQIYKVIVQNFHISREKEGVAS